MRRALEALIMERQSEGKATFPPFAQQLIDRGRLEGKPEGISEGELKGKRDARLRLLTRAEITLSDAGRARIQTCTDSATLDRWVNNIIGAKTAAEVLS